MSKDIMRFDDFKLHLIFVKSSSEFSKTLRINPEQPLREVALSVGITERAVLRIVAELEESGYLLRHRNGRQNTYEMHPEIPLRHPLESHCTIGDLLNVIVQNEKKF